MAYTRFSVASEQGKENLKIMAQAIVAMKNMEATNPLSWEYQAAIHGTNNPALINAPFANGCPHYNQAGDDTAKFFLVWHRLSLYYFEQAIRAVSGRQDFTLPYWDATDPNQRTIPKEFLSPENGGYPGLFDPDRGKTFKDPSIPVVNLNDGITLLPRSDLYDQAMQDVLQVDNSGYDIFNATIDQAPHGMVHGDLKGKMLAFETAALEPLFWLHHCNIDRLWAEYSNDAVDAEAFSKLTPGLTIGFFKQNGDPVTYDYKQAATAIYALDYNYDTGANTLKPSQKKSSLAFIQNLPKQTHIIQHLVGQSKFKLGLIRQDPGTELDNLKNQRLTLQPNPLYKTSNNNARSILSISLDSCHDTTGHIDVLISGQRQRRWPLNHQDNFADDAITNYTFKQLKQRANGAFLDRQYAGSINFIPHSSESSNMSMQGTSSELNSKDCGESKTYLFDITDELKNSGIQAMGPAATPINITFNIDPEHNNLSLSTEVILKQAMIYNVY